jgi:putative YjhG/YagF family dehydratase
MSISSLLDSGGDLIRATRTKAGGPSGSLPFTPEMLLGEPSGNLFGMTQDAGMGWDPDEVTRPQVLVLSTLGGLRDDDGRPIALGYHTGHWELGLLVKAAAERLRQEGALPFAAYCSDPCDGRTQGTAGMYDSLAYRNDAAVTMRRLIRSLPRRVGVMGIATCDKGLPATLLALAGCRDRPGIVVPGGVTLPAVDAEDAGTIQSLGTRFAHGLITLEEAASLGCRACGSPGGGCQFLGTAATSQIVAEALGLALPHSALSPSGEPVWLDLARRSATAILHLAAIEVPMSAILTSRALENAMLLHAAVGGSTNLLLHIPAIAHAAGLRVPGLDDWKRVNRTVPRLVDALPNGPANHPTVQVFMAGGVPEVMLHLKDMGLLNLDVLTVTGEKLSAVLEWWRSSERRSAAKSRLRESDGIDADRVIMSAERARAAGLTSTVVFPVGNVAPGGSVVKSTAIAASAVGDDGVYHHRGPARVFVSEQDAVQAVKRTGAAPAVEPHDVVVLIGAGPLGTGMEEIFQLTSALKALPWGQTVSVVTDARFSGVSTGACIGHVGPEALANGPIGRLRDGDLVEVVIDRRNLSGTVDLVGIPSEDGVDAGIRMLDQEEAARVLAERPAHAGLRPRAGLPDDTRLWAALQQASGGVWNGCVYDVDRIIALLDAGMAKTAGPTRTTVDR